MKTFAGGCRVCVAILSLAPIGLAGGCGAVYRAVGVKTACELGAAGVAADAEIESIWDTGITVNDDPVIGLRVRVLASDRPPFEAEIPKALIGRLTVPRFQPGNRVPVVYDAHNPAKVGLDVYDCH